MFCPKCGAQNLVEQKYCRSCGHQLTSHRAALEGEYEDATAHLKKGSALVSTGLVVGGICKLNILASWFMGADNLGIIINTLVALLIAIPLITIGVIRLGQARRVLSPKDPPGNEAVDKSTERAIHLPAAPTTDRSISLPAMPASVTEHTTLDLIPPQQTRQEPQAIRRADAIEIERP
jgi:hypothetical protein